MIDNKGKAIFITLLLLSYSLCFSEGTETESLQGDNPLIYQHSAEAYLQNDELDKAIKVLEKGVKSFPQSADMHYYLGEVLRIKMERTSWINFPSKMSIGEKSWISLKEAVRLDPNHFDAHFSLGFMYYGAPKFYKKINDAINEFQICLKLKPDSAKAHYWLGNTFEKKGLLKEAISEWEKALEIDPNYSNTKKKRNEVIKMDNQTKNLIAIGTSVGANCQSCLKYFVDKARENGVNEQEIREAIEVANMVKKGASSKNG